MRWVGLTGCMGCGKSTVGRYYQSLGYQVISADKVVKDLYQKKEVCDLLISEFKFQPDLNPDELMTELSKSIFKEKTKLERLEKILHPLVRKEVATIKSKIQDEIAFYDVPLLFEKNMQDQFDYIICVGTDIKTQSLRIKERNNWSEEQIQDRLKNQLSIEEKKEVSDFYIDNSSDLENLEKQAKAVLDKILS